MQSSAPEARTQLSDQVVDAGSARAVAGASRLSATQAAQLA
jgi:hypothetical protein